MPSNIGKSVIKLFIFLKKLIRQKLSFVLKQLQLHLSSPVKSLDQRLKIYIDESLFSQTIFFNNFLFLTGCSITAAQQSGGRLISEK